MGCGAIGGLCLLKPPSKIIREDGTTVATTKPRGVIDELKANLDIFTDCKLLIMVPAFLPAECFLVYLGSVNAFGNNLRTRSLLSFVAVVMQVPTGWGLQMILDNKTWKRKNRALAGLSVVGTVLVAAWIWQLVSVRNIDRHNPSTQLVDWSDTDFGPVFVRFVLTWIGGSLWQNLILYYLGCFSNNPRKAANYAGVFRGFLGAGEAICFGVDSIAVPFIGEGGVIAAFYFTGIGILFYLAMFHIKETQYFTHEEDVVVPKHVLEENAIAGFVPSTDGSLEAGGKVSELPVEQTKHE